MAYREFHYEKIYEAPDVNILAEGLLRGAENTSIAIGNLFRGLAEQQAAKRKAADQFKFDLGEGKFENDDKIFFQKGVNITQRGKNEIRNTGRLSPQLEQDQNMALMEKKQSDWQFKTMTQYNEEIAARAKEDLYYDPEIDLNKLRIAAYGEDNDVYYATRGERMEQFAAVRGKDPKSLKGKLYTFDYVGKFREKEKIKSTGSPTAESTYADKSPFLNEQGAPGVTITHAKEYLNSRGDGSVARWVESLVHDDMDADVRYMKGRDPELKNMTDDEVKLFLKSNPERNLYNKKDFATRVIEKAQDQLFEAASISKKIDYTTKVDKTLTGGLYNNDAIGHTYTTQDDVVGTETSGVSQDVAGAFKLNINKMPGGILRIGKGAKLGQAIPLELNPRFSYNIRTGQNQENRGTTAFNLTGYQTAAYSKDGKLIPMDAATIDKLPNSAFQNLEPSLNIGLRGFTLDYGNKLGEVASHQERLDNELAAAIQANDLDKQERIQTQLQQVEQLKQLMNLSPSEFSSDDLLSAFKKAGISTTSIKKDIVVKASQADIDLINRNITQGLNLSDKSKWGPDMLDADARYQKRYQQAAAAGFKDQGPAEEFSKAMKQKPAKPRTVMFNNEELEVPAGRIAVQKPDGSIVTIPSGQRDAAAQRGYKIIE